MSTEPATPVTTPAGQRLVGLDGLRGLAALYVVIYHIFLRAFPGSSADHAPFWAAGFRYGRLAVVVFIVLSGFSLAVGAARAGWRLDSVARFAHRRAWRILPPYWAALGFSLLVTWFVVAQPGWSVPTAKSVAVNGLLLQDIVAAPSPNRAFWSIAIEAQLYVVFPLLILAVGRFNAITMLALVAAPVLTLGACASAHQQVAANLVNQYTPDLAVLFAVGVAAAGILTTTEGRRARPWHRYALVLGCPVFALIAWRGAVWTSDNLFWIDLAIGPAIGCLLAALATNRPRPLVRLLDSRPLRRLGSFSYSLYLTHAPIVLAIYYGPLQGRVPQGAPMFLLLCAVILPLTILFAWLFAQVFELPFQRRRGWAAVRAALQSPAFHPHLTESSLKIAQNCPGLIAWDARGAWGVHQDRSACPHQVAQSIGLDRVAGGKRDHGRQLGAVAGDLSDRIGTGRRQADCDVLLAREPRDAAQPGGQAGRQVSAFPQVDVQQAGEVDSRPELGQHLHGGQGGTDLVLAGHSDDCDVTRFDAVLAGSAQQVGQAAAAGQAADRLPESAQTDRTLYELLEAGHRRLRSAHHPDVLAQPDRARGEVAGKIQQHDRDTSRRGILGDAQGQPGAMLRLAEDREQRTLSGADGGVRVEGDRMLIEGHADPAVGIITEAG